MVTCVVSGQIIAEIRPGRVARGAPQGALGGFLESRLRQYVEPSREGTPKGQPVGFSRSKYHATLLGLTSLDLHRQAREAGVAYGVLRKWRTETAFKKAVTQHALAFVTGPLRLLAATALGLESGRAEIRFTTPVAPALAAQFVGDKHLADAKLYGDALLTLAIVDLTHLEPKGDALVSWTPDTARFIAGSLLVDKLLRARGADRSRYRLSSVRRLNAWLQHLLKVSNFSEDTKTVALHVLVLQQAIAAE